MTTGQGSTANVAAAICSFFIPGLGQLVQGRLLRAGFMFVLAAILWWIWMGWIVHIGRSGTPPASGRAEPASRFTETRGVRAFARATLSPLRRTS